MRAKTAAKGILAAVGCLVAAWLFMRLFRPTTPTGPTSERRRLPSPDEEFRRLASEGTREDLQRFFLDKNVVEVSYAYPLIDATGASTPPKPPHPFPSEGRISEPDFRLYVASGGMRGIGHSCPVAIIMADVSGEQLERLLDYHYEFLENDYLVRGFGLYSYRVPDELRARVDGLVREALRGYLLDLQMLGKRYRGLSGIGPEHLNLEKRVLEYRRGWTKARLTQRPPRDDPPCHIFVDVQDLTRLGWEEWASGPFGTFRRLGIEVNLGVSYDGQGNDTTQGKENRPVVKAIQLFRRRVEPLKDLDRSLYR